MDKYCHYYANQCGGALPYYEGVAHQKGHGIGNILKGVFRSVGQVLPTVGKAIGQQALESGIGLAKDIIGGENIKSAIKRRALEGGKSLFQTAVTSGLCAINRAAPQEGGRRRKARKTLGRRGVSKRKYRRKQSGQAIDIFS